MILVSRQLHVGLSVKLRGRHGQLNSLSGAGRLIRKISPFTWHRIETKKGKFNSVPQLKNEITKLDVTLLYVLLWFGGHTWKCVRLYELIFFELPPSKNQKTWLFISFVFFLFSSFLVVAFTACFHSHLPFQKVVLLVVNVLILPFSFNIDFNVMLP